MLLARSAQVSREVAATSARSEKTALLAELFREAEADDVPIVIPDGREVKPMETLSDHPRGRQGSMKQEPGGAPLRGADRNRLLSRRRGRQREDKRPQEAGTVKTLPTVHPEV